MAIGNVHLTPQLVQAVRDAVDVVAIASDHTKLTKAGNRHKGLCPLHKEKTPSFSVDPVRGLFYCFGCGVGGDAIKLHMLVTGDDFPAAIESLAMRYGIPLPTRKQASSGGKRERDLRGALEAAQGFFREALERSELPRRYLAERKVPAELVERYGVGFAPEAWRDLLSALSRDVSVADLVAAGLVVEKQGAKPYDRFRNRLIFPIHAPAGRLVGFGGRTLGDDRAKYINSNETAQFHKGRLLYGLAQSKVDLRETRRAILVEGYFDVVGAAAAGLTGAVAAMGTALTPEQARLLVRFADEVVVAYDGDEAGSRAFRRALPLLLAEGLEVRRARFPDGHDPDSLRLEEGPEAVVTAIEGAEDAVMAEIERLAPRGLESEPHAQARAAKAVGELLAPIPDRIVRFGYGRLAADRLGVPADMLWRRAAAPERRAPAPEELPPERPPVGPKIVWSLEEQALQVLFSGKSVPREDELPPEEAFTDPSCRNIFRAFCALYRRGQGTLPDSQAVLAELGDQGGAVDRMAEILLEDSAASGSAALPTLLEQLWRRYRKQRQRELAREVREAQHRGDVESLDRLSRELEELSQSLHLGHHPKP